MRLNGVNIVVRPDYPKRLWYIVRTKRKWGPKTDRVCRVTPGNVLRDGEIAGDSKTAIMNPRTHSALLAAIDRYGNEVVEP